MGLFASPTAVRAALLNLSGLGAGYLYLRKWIFFGVALVVTAGLLVGAALHGAADHLLIWLPVLLVWFLAAGVHGLFVGRSHDERTAASGGQPTKRIAPVLTAAGLVVAVTAALAGVWQAGEWRLQVADAVHARGECVEAVDIYGRVEGAFQLSMSPSLMDRARSGAEACDILTRAQQQMSDERYDQAIATYGEYFAHPASRWEDTDGEVADANLSYAGSIAEETAEAYTGEITDEIREGFQQAHEIYSDIPDNYEGTEAAGRVPNALVELYDLGTADYDEELWCDAFEQIQVFADLDWSFAPSVAQQIDAESPEAARRCGWDEVEDGSADRAEEMTDFLAAEYPDHEADDVEDLVRHVGAAHVEEAMDTLRRGGESSFEVQSTGSADGDVAVLDFTNDSAYDMRLLYVGEDGVHDDITAEACGDCEDYSSPPSGNSCFDRGGESIRVELEPGEYRMLLVLVDETRPMHGTVNLSGGNSYESCFFVVE